jgi:anti-anti-sigma regulatory factor
LRGDLDRRIVEVVTGEFKETGMSEQILAIGASLDRNGSNDLRRALESALSTRSHAVCFDASSLQHADANGLSELFAMIAKVLEQGREAIISGASASMLALFELVQLDCVAEIHGLEEKTAPKYSGNRQQPAASPMFAAEFVPQLAS